MKNIRKKKQTLNDLVATIIEVDTEITEVDNKIPDTHSLVTTTLLTTKIEN